MRKLSHRNPLIVLPLLLVAAINRPCSAGDPAALLPSSTVAYAELQNVSALVDIIWNHPLRAKIESIDDIRKAYESQEFLEFKAGVAIFEAQLGKPWHKALADLADGGVAVGVAPKTQGIAAFVQAKDEETLTKFLATLVNLARADAQQNGKPDPIKTGEHRGVQAFQLAEARVAQLGATLLITNKSDLGKAVIDAHLDGLSDSLAQNERFQEAKSKRPNAAQLWGFVDIEAVRDANIAENVFKAQADNPAIELLVGGILSTLRETPYATVAAELTPAKLAVTVETPHSPNWTPESRDYYFGPEGKGRAPKALQVQNQIFSLGAYRNVSEMWLRAGDLFDENTNDGLAQAESTLSTLFSGKDFGEEILGAIHPEMQLVVAQQNFEGVLPIPSTRLPAFALVAKLRDPKTMQRELRRIFQSLIGFLNVTGAMNDQPQLDLDQTRDGESLIVSAEYAPEDDEKESTDARINFNFSPAVAFRGDMLVISSTKRLAREIVQKHWKEGAQPSEDNTRAELNVRQLQSALAVNREHLIAQNMLEEGHTRAEAEQEIGLLLSLLEAVNRVALRLTPTENRLQLAAEIELATEAAR